MAFISSDEDTSYRAIERGTTRSGLKRRTNNDDLPHRPRSLEKGGSEDREGKKATKVSPEIGGPDTITNENSTDHAFTKNGKLSDQTRIRKSQPIPTSIRHTLVGGSNNTTTPRLNTDDTVRDAHESTVQNTSTARVPDTKRNIPVANYDFIKAPSHPIPRTGDDAKDISNSEKLLKALTDDQGGISHAVKSDKF
jgi:hypothetical protein